MSLLRMLYRGQADFDFRRAWRVGFALSGLMVLVSIGAFVGRGLNMGIEFEGGTTWEFEADLTVEEVRDVMAAEGFGTAKIQVVGGDVIRVSGDTEDPAEITGVTQALAEAGEISVNDISTQVVGPSWGDEISAAARRALVAFFVVISAYISLRLEWKMAIGAFVAVVHDIIITIGIYALFQFEVTPSTIIAVLTILGFSLYDTIVVYDRARENAARYAVSARLAYTDVMSLSMNQVLMRSVNTTVVAILPIVSMLVVGSVALGAKPLQEFAIALLVGLLAGAYSSIFIAAPGVAIIKEREPRWSQIRARLDGRESSTSAASATPAATDLPTGFGHAPRPRKARSRSRRRG